MSRELAALVEKGTDIAERLSIFHEDLRRGKNELEARGVMEYEFDGWINAARHVVNRTGTNDDRARWREIDEAIGKNQYYGGYDMEARVAYLTNLFRRRL